MCGFMGMDPTRDKTNDYEGLDSLKTPYNDEISLGLQQEILSTTWRLTYVHREGYDEVRSRTKYNNLTGQINTPIKEKSVPLIMPDAANMTPLPWLSATVSRGNGDRQPMSLPPQSSGRIPKPTSRLTRAMPSSNRVLPLTPTK